MPASLFETTDMDSVKAAKQVLFTPFPPLLTLAQASQTYGQEHSQCHPSKCQFRARFRDVSGSLGHGTQVGLDDDQKASRNPGLTCTTSDCKNLHVLQRVLDHDEQTTRILRIFMSHTVSSQVWQTGGEGIANMDTGEGIPSWTLKIEGRLLEVSLSGLCLVQFTPTTTFRLPTKRRTSCQEGNSRRSSGGWLLN